MKKVIAYRSADGKNFNTEKECHKYEHELCNALIDSIHLIHDICEQHGTDCSGCLFYTGSRCIMAQLTMNYDTPIGYTPNTWNNTFSLE